MYIAENICHKLIANKHVLSSSKKNVVKFNFMTYNVGKSGQKPYQPAEYQQPKITNVLAKLKQLKFIDYSSTC